jgi:hypothetical protein
MRELSTSPGRAILIPAAKIFISTPTACDFSILNRGFARLDEFDAHLFWGGYRDEIRVFKRPLHGLCYAMISYDSVEHFEDHAVLLISKSVLPSRLKARRRNYGFSKNHAEHPASRLPSRILPQF